MMLRNLILFTLCALAFLSCEEASEPQVEVSITEETIPKSDIPKEIKPQKLVKKSSSSSVQTKKERFKKMMVPAIKKVRSELQNQYDRILAEMNRGEQVTYDDLKRLYRVETNEELLQALKPHPTSIVLAQAALESAWGTSRFFQKANNVFGVWSSDENEPRIAAGTKRGDQTIYLKRYDSIEDSIKDYFLFIGRGSAFKEFRELRVKTDDPFKLVEKLDNYSEQGASYGKELSSIIRYNKFREY